MKRLLLSAVAWVFLFSTVHAQYDYDQTGYPGDFFSLEGAIELFKESRTLREFERKINSHDRYVNNLDLNYDGRTDYIRVEHRRSGNFHAIILQAPLGRRDIQDIAVIELEKTGRREAILQIIGDREIYGEELIVEPIESYSYSGYQGRSHTRYAANEYVNVYYWPLVQYIFGRDYRIYASPYRWNVYPTWWSPWRPYSWKVYRPRIRNYYNTCRVVTIFRLPRVHKFYRPYRSYSHHVVKHTHEIRKRRGTAHIHRSRSPHGVGNKDVRIYRESPGSKRVQGETTGTRPKVHQPRTYGSARSSAKASQRRTSRSVIRPKSQPSTSRTKVEGRKSLTPKVQGQTTTRRSNSSITRPGVSRGTTSPSAKQQVRRPSTSTQRNASPRAKQQVRRPTSTQRNASPRAKQQVRRPSTSTQRNGSSKAKQQVRRLSTSTQRNGSSRAKQQVLRPSTSTHRNTTPRKSSTKTAPKVQRRSMPKASSSVRSMKSTKAIHKDAPRSTTRKKVDSRRSPSRKSPRSR